MVAAALVEDNDHRASVDLFAGLHMAGRGLLVPATVVAEVGYLLNREAEPRVEAMFLESLAEGDFVPVELAQHDYARMSELVTQYGDLPSGITDASGGVLGTAPQPAVARCRDLSGEDHLGERSTTRSTIDSMLRELRIEAGAGPSTASG